MIVGIAGGSGAGKTTFVQRLVDALPPNSTTVLSHDAYYRDLGHLPAEDRARANFDHPDALETDLLVEHINALRQGRAACVPTYDFVAHTRGDTTTRVKPTATVIVEGILLLAHERLRAALDLAVYIDVERGRSLESCVRQWRDTVRPMHDAFVRPSIAHADIIVPHGGHNAAAARTIAAYVVRSG